LTGGALAYIARAMIVAAAIVPAIRRRRISAARARLSA
jgi:hypothetical protein